jgi:hypothetical protein
MIEMLQNGSKTRTMNIGSTTGSKATRRNGGLRWMWGHARERFSYAVIAVGTLSKPLGGLSVLDCSPSFDVSGIWQ